MRVFHGTATHNVFKLLEGASTRGSGLYVTDTAERAQLYADAQASGSISRTVRNVAGSAVVELETAEPVTWDRRPDDHPTLDRVEAVIKTWQIVRVTVNVRQYDLTASRTNLGAPRDPRYVPTYDYLRSRLGDKLQINIVT